MHPYLRFSIELLKNIKIQLLIGVFSFFIIALLLSTTPGRIYLFLWLLVGAFALYFIRLTFPDVWNYTFWLMGIFLLNFLAVLCLLETRFTSYSFFIAIGILLEMITLGIDVLLILHIKAIRDDISGVTERPAGFDLHHEAAYIPLGLWSLSVFLFWFVSNLSILYWYNWSVGTWGPGPYFLSEVILLCIIVYILWHPQMNFDWGVEPITLPAKPSLTDQGIFGKAGGLIPRFKKRVSISRTPPKKCPICGAKIVSEQRSCRYCGQKRIFTWCKISEGYIVTCPHCKAQTSYGNARCINCARPLTQNVRCQCGTEHRIRDWEYLKTIG